MSFQDWNHIVFSGKPSLQPKKKMRENSPTRKLANETDVPQLEVLSSDVKNKIISMRVAKKMSQTELANKLNCNKAIIAEYESGSVRNPNKNFIQKIFKALA